MTQALQIELVLGRVLTVVPAMIGSTNITRTSRLTDSRILASSRKVSLFKVDVRHEVLEEDGHVARVPEGEEGDDVHEALADRVV